MLRELIAGSTTGRSSPGADDTRRSPVQQGIGSGGPGWYRTRSPASSTATGTARLDRVGQHRRPARHRHGAGAGLRLIEVFGGLAHLPVAVVERGARSRRRPRVRRTARARAPRGGGPRRLSWHAARIAAAPAGSPSAPSAATAASRASASRCECAVAASAATAPARDRAAPSSPSAHAAASTTVTSGSSSSRRARARRGRVRERGRELGGAAAHRGRRGR